jgi:hypothetical protein
MIAAAREVGEFGSVSTSRVAEVPVEQRTGMLENLPLEERVPLADRWDRFLRLNEESEKQVRRTAAAVAAQTDAESLLTTMEWYAVWIEKLSPELRDQIESEDTEVQRQAIDEAIAVTQASTIWRSRDQLDDEAVERIYFALRQILHQRIDDGDEATIKHEEMIRNWSTSAGFLPEGFDIEPFVIMGLVTGRDDDGGFNRGRRGPPFGGGRSRDRPASLGDDELEMIRLILPDDAHDTLELVSSSVDMEDTLVLRNLTLRGWAEEATRRKMPRRPETTLLQRYNDLLPEERQRIDLLPPKEMLERIKRGSRPSWPSR